MRIQSKIFHLLLLFGIIHLSTQCYFQTEKNRTSCSNFIEASAEAKEEWYNLIVYNANRILTLKANTFLRMPNLRELTISSVKEIEMGAFNGLNKLDQLNFFDTKMSEFPTDLYSHLNIRNIQIFQNPKFEEIPIGYFDKIPQVRQVDFRVNSLTKIPVGIFNSTAIYKMYLDRNKIEEIEDGALQDMEGLVHLSLTDNRIADFDSMAIVGKSYSIKTFWCDKNKITRVDKKLLEGFPILERLFLEVNEISYIELGVFSLVPQLNLIDLSHNKLVEIPPKIFPLKQSKLLHFFLHSNRFTYLDESLFYRIPNLKYVTFGGNPLQCPCETQLTEFIARKNIIRLCENVFFSGERPTCIISELSSKDCIYDAELTASLYHDYNNSLSTYPPLKQKCDVTAGVETAVLTDVN